mmetsp:Transcript_14112/g.26405  ORF Transcript_14112/g.26405 Transcript_14112/m.26405 type:complete len:214 (-) Transcript_14112:153-794(-)
MMRKIGTQKTATTKTTAAARASNPGSTAGMTTRRIQAPITEGVGEIVVNTTTSMTTKVVHRSWKRTSTRWLQKKRRQQQHKRQLQRQKKIRTSRLMRRPLQKSQKNRKSTKQLLPVARTLPRRPRKQPKPAHTIRHRQPNTMCRLGRPRQSGKPCSTSTRRRQKLLPTSTVTHGTIGRCRMMPTHSGPVPGKRRGLMNFYPKFSFGFCRVESM